MFVRLFLGSFTRLKLRPHILTNEDEAPNFIGKKCIGVSVSFIFVHPSCLFLRSQQFFFVNTNITNERQTHFIYTKSPKYGSLYNNKKVNIWLGYPSSTDLQSITKTNPELGQAVIHFSFEKLGYWANPHICEWRISVYLYGIHTFPYCHSLIWKNRSDKITEIHSTCQNM